MTSAALLVALEPAKGVAARFLDGEVQVREFALPSEADGQAGPASAVKEALAALGHDGGGICLGVPSAHVMAAQVPTDDLPRKGRRSLLLYRLEEHLPMDAEEITADFLPAAGGRSLGIAIETAGVAPLIGALTEAGIEVEAISPTALLALWQLVEESEVAADFYLLAFEDHTDIFRMMDGQPVAWYVTSPETAAVCQAMHVDLLARPIAPASGSAVLAGALTEGQAQAIAADTGIACKRVEGKPLIAEAAVAAQALVAGTGAGWINLRRDALAPAERLRRLRRPLQAAAALAMLLMVATCIAAWVRVVRYEAEASRLTDQQRAVFARLYPNVRVPPGIRRWMESEASRLAGLSGAAGALPEQPSALETLRRAAGGFPKDLRFRLVDIRVEPGEILLEGQARSHADAETVAKGIASGGFVMESPRTENLVRGGVAFTLAGKPAAANAAATKPPVPSAAVPGTIAPGKAPPKVAAPAVPTPTGKGGKP